MSGVTKYFNNNLQTYIYLYFYRIVLSQQAIINDQSILN
jgi:hypothetical protein